MAPASQASGGRCGPRQRQRRGPRGQTTGAGDSKLWSAVSHHRFGFFGVQCVSTALDRMVWSHVMKFKRVANIFGYVAVLCVGVLAGRIWGALQNSSAFWSQFADRESDEVSSRVTVLSQLRLGRVDDAINTLEVPLDGQIMGIALAESSSLILNPASMSRSRLDALQEAKAYRSVYPSEAESTEPPPATIFAQIPEITFPAECESALCKLVKDRQSKEANP